MLRSSKSLFGYPIEALDGEIGSAHDFLFDEEGWYVRYLVVDTRKWLPGRKVLVAPEAIGSPRWEEKIFPVSLSREQIEKSPLIDTDKPVSREMEMELYAYYSWQPYWGLYGAPIMSSAPIQKPTSEEEVQTKLRSVREVTGYHIIAEDGEIGHLEDLIVDDKEWAVRYLIVKTRNWLPGKTVILSPAWVTGIAWSTKTFRFDLQREHIKNAPEYNPEMPVNREYEERLYDFYGRPHYWA
ncbi:MAG: PRC-barrel domain containing protein [Spartobacteria bacterium]|nr:PRC-barrel domain containing protein [Spartobacteria bacterium]